MIFAVMVSMILKILNVKNMSLIKAKVKANVCQKRYRDYNVGGYKKLNFAGLMMRFSYFLNQLINTNINVNMY